MGLFHGATTPMKRLAVKPPSASPMKRAAQKVVATVHMDEQTVHDSHFATTEKRLAKKAPPLTPVKRLAKKGMR